MYDWKAKITRLLELPGLTDEQKGTFDMHIDFIELTEIFPHSGLKDVRFDEQLIRLDLERLIEARGGLWGVWVKNPEELDSWQLHTPYQGTVYLSDLESWQLGATPAQALCDALLSAVEETPNV